MSVSSSLLGPSGDSVSHRTVNSPTLTNLLPPSEVHATFCLLDKGRESSLIFHLLHLKLKAPEILIEDRTNVIFIKLFLFLLSYFNEK